VSEVHDIGIGMYQEEEINKILQPSPGKSQT
jgi:hypothetical protein